jgi:uncharacterized protein DUF2064
MAKAPASGYVKTRLCPPLSLEEAAQLYQCFLEDKIAQVRGVQGVEPVVAYAPENAAATFEALAPGLTRAAQRGGDLTSRLVSVLEPLFASGFDAAMVIVSDTPTLSLRAPPRRRDASRFEGARSRSRAERGRRLLSHRAPADQSGTLRRHALERPDRPRRDAQTGPGPAAQGGTAGAVVRRGHPSGPGEAHVRARSRRRTRAGPYPAPAPVDGGNLCLRRRPLSGYAS